jgi:hypothetical protein
MPQPMDAYPYLVHVVVATRDGLACRPAVVVADLYHDGHMVNVEVFTDALNDGLDPVYWAQSVEHSLEGRLHTYHLMREHAIAAEGLTRHTTEESHDGTDAGPADPGIVRVELRDSIGVNPTEG